MADQLEIVNNIVSKLNQDPKYCKDYILPFINPLMASLLGFFVAKYTLDRQENSNIEKHKLDATNKLLLNAHDAMQELMSIKQNYFAIICDDPLLRLVQIPSLMNNSNKINVDLSDLVFIVPNDKESVTTPKWLQLPYIKGCFDNYNATLELWSFLSPKILDLKTKLVDFFPGQAYGELDSKTANQLYSNIISTKDLTTLIDLSERTLALTDDLLIEFDRLLKDFPQFAKRKMDKSWLKKHGKVLTFSNENNELINNILRKIPPPNVERYTNLFGLTAEELRVRWSTGYESDT